ncbi:Crp/Fnr family transcriptional regulator [Streptomyces sp. NPDC088785]|uniref:Crp/Fnr family transcriptional regulator n=1 Tax=Streptomyces sp. NPDC088785 TaxID=3365897 RepID=UPI0037F26E17
MSNGTQEWPARSLLGVLSPPARKEMLELGTAAVFEQGEVLLHEGRRDRHVVLLLSGFAKVTAGVENGEVSLLAVRVGGDTVGEMAAMDGSPRSATVTACGRVTSRILQQADLHALLMRRPEIAMALAGIVSDRLRWANRRRLDFRGYSAKARLARLLVELATAYGRPGDGGVVIGCRLTHARRADPAGRAPLTARGGRPPRARGAAMAPG